MNWNLKAVSIPSISPVSVEEVKTHTHIDHDIDDLTIDMWIKSATEQAEDYQNKSYINRSYDLSFDGFPPLPVKIPRSPLVSVTSIIVYNQANTPTILDPNNFFVDTNSTPGRICHSSGSSWPSITLRELNSVVIRYVAGFGVSSDNVPSKVIDAIMLYCAYRNENRASETDTAPKQFFDILRSDRVKTGKLWC